MTQRSFIIAITPGKCGWGCPVIVKINNNYYEAQSQVRPLGLTIT